MKIIIYGSQYGTARKYAEEFEDYYDEVLCYGISFYKKRCQIKRKER